MKRRKWIGVEGDGTTEGEIEEEMRRWRAAGETERKEELER